MSNERNFPGTENIEDHANFLLAGAFCRLALMDALRWWNDLPPNLRQDIEGSGAEPAWVVKARKAIDMMVE